MKNYGNSNTKVMYIIIYDENKGNINNNIDFILMIDDYNEMKKNLNFILKNNIWIYLKNINFPIVDDEKEIINDKGEKIGYIFRNGKIKRKEEIKEIQKLKSKDITATKNIVPKFNSILMLLYISNFVNELYNFSLDNKNVITKIFVEYFINFQADKIKSIFSKSIKIDNFEDIFDEIFEKLDLELSNKNEIKELNGKIDQLEVFKKQYKNVSIIKKLFYCPLEIKKYCPYCTKTYYKYKYKKIILLKSIDNEKENLLFEKIFKPEEIEKKERCKLCYRESKCLNYKKFISFPMILIILIEEDQIGELNIKKEIKNDKGISYQLYCLIEANTNMVYYKNDYGLWLRFGENKKEEIESKIPIVLFYKLMSIKNNALINNNINNQFRNNNNQNLINNNTNNINVNNNNLNNMNENYININNSNNLEKNNLNKINNNSFQNNMDINYINMNNVNNMNINNLYNMNNMNMMNLNNRTNNLNENCINMNNKNMNINNLINMNNNNITNNSNNMICMNKNFINMNNNNLNNINNNNINNMNNMKENYINMNNMNNININFGYRNNINQFNQINNLGNQTMDLARQNFELNKEIEKLRYELDSEKNINKNLEEKLIKNQILLNEKDAEIAKLKLRNSFELSEGEKLISITFISFDESILYSIICKNTYKFIEIENMLYDKYIEYKNKNNIFLFNGKSINPNKTLEENNIKNGDIISFKFNA